MIWICCLLRLHISLLNYFPYGITLHTSFHSLKLYTQKEDKGNILYEMLFITTLWKLKEIKYGLKIGMIKGEREGLGDEAPKRYLQNLRLKRWRRGWRRKGQEIRERKVLQQTFKPHLMSFGKDLMWRFFSYSTQTKHIFFLLCCEIKHHIYVCVCLEREKERQRQRQNES